MTRSELLERLRKLDTPSLVRHQRALAALIHDIEKEGVLDVQQPPPAPRKETI